MKSMLCLWLVFKLLTLKTAFAEGNVKGICTRELDLDLAHVCLHKKQCDAMASMAIAGA